MNQPIIEAKNFDPAAEKTVPIPPDTSGEVTPPVTPETPETPPATADATATDRKPGESEVDWKKRHDDSARENQRMREEIARKDEELAAAREQVTKVAELQLEADLRIEHPDWEVMSDQEKEMTRTALREKRRREQSDAELASYRRKDEFENSFATLVASDEFKILASHRDAFHSYVNANPNTDIKVLARSFLFDIKDEVAAQETAARAARSGLEAPTGAPSSVTQNDGMSDEQLQALANSDPKAFAALMQKRTQKRQADAVSGRR